MSEKISELPTLSRDDGRALLSVTGVSGFPGLKRMAKRVKIGDFVEIRIFWPRAPAVLPLLP